MMMMSLGRDLERLRKEQGRRVMPLIGSLLDAWEHMPNDLRNYLDEACPMLSHYMERINQAMEGNRCICPPTSEQTCQNPTCPRKGHNQ